MSHADEGSSRHSEGLGVADAPPRRVAFVRRIWMVFMRPTELFEGLALNPAWFPAALFGALVTAGCMALLPAEMFVTVVESQVMDEEAAAQLSAVPDTFYKLLAVGGGGAAPLLAPLFFGLVTYVVFVFIRGDEGSFRQHLCVWSHAGIIGAVGAVFTLPLQMLSGDVTRTLSLGSLVPFLSEGYLLRFLTGLGLFSLWSFGVAGLGLATLAEKRSPASAVRMVVFLLVAFTAVMALFGA